MPEPWSWKSIPRPSEAPRPGTGWLRTVVELTVPLVVAGVLVAFGRPVVAAIVAGIGLTLFVVTRASAAARAKVEHGFAVLAFWVGEVLTFVLLTPVYYGILTPVALWLRLRGVDPLDTAIDRRRSSYWVDASFERPKRRYFQQFTYERYADPPAPRSNPLVRLGTAALWLVLLNTVLGMLLVRAGVGTRAPLDFRAASAVYRTDPAAAEWAPVMWGEYARAKARNRPFVHWERLPFDGRYVNVRDGMRVTPGGAPAEPPSPDLAEVWFFGGSTMWGVGSRDEGTIPAAFERHATRAGRSVRASNHGEDGYVQWQEILLLTDLLAAGRVPRVVVSYDGVNDVFAYFQAPDRAREERIHQNLHAWDERFDRVSLVRALVQRSGVHALGRALGARRVAHEPDFSRVPWTAAATPEEVGALLADRYLEGVAHLEHLARAYGFDLVVAWQPSVYTKRVRSDEEERHAAAFGSELARIYEAAHERVRAALDRHPALVDLSDAFGDTAETLYVDWCHVGEASNDLLAGRLFDLVAPHLAGAS